MATNAHAATVEAKQELGIVPSYKDAGVHNRIVKIAAAYKEAAAQEKRWKQEKEDLRNEALVELSKAGLNAKQGESVAVMVGTLKVTAIASHNSSISKEKLLEAGVPAETIVEATVETPYEYITVSDVEQAATVKRERKAGVKNIASARAKNKAKGTAKKSKN